jgi:hypothetical protein
MSEWSELLLFMLILSAPRLMALAIVRIICRVSARYDVDMTPEREKRGTPC